MSSNIIVENLVDKSRFPNTVNETLGIIVYFPFGVILAFLRVFIGLNAIVLTLILSHYPNVRRSLLRIMLGILGLLVVKKKNSASKNSKVLVSNYLSIFDHIAIYLATGTFTPTKRVKDPLALFFGLVSLIPYNNTATENAVLKRFISNENDENSLVLFPEGAPTNGKCALLRFSTLPANISNNLQPVVVTIKRPPFANVNLSVLGSKTIFEILWFLFVPFTIFEYKLLNVIERSEDETDESLMSRVEVAISQELNISTSNITKNDKKEYEKKYFLELAENAGKHVDNFEEDPETLRMAAQVSDVLPYVPRNVIVANLRRTRSVDITITNILDGTVKYTPLPKSSKESKTITKNTAPNNFGVGSFMERKTKLIDEARQRYIKKHGLHHLVH
ncbi:Ubiquitin system component Cue [Cinara cedri]|uniref:Lipid droplet-regulating VLDL assembly factor AUP1 n=1 Tax=Cinara cedri TaxID=506608 RepID=A0A5E4MYH2_9HEMI|nr:Ubiquitin system component Cue [Cinara cedri]